MDNFIGTGVALVTPFDGQGRIDEVSLRKLVNHVIEGGVDFLVPLGTTGESATLSMQEKAEVIRIVADENHNRLPLMAGIGGNNTATVVRELEETPWLKECQAVLSVTPYYNKPSQQGLYEHYRAVAAAAPLPVYLYNVPGRTGVNMTAATVCRLSHDCPNIAGIKDASGNFEQSTAILKDMCPGFIALSGDDATVLPLMSIGFEGVISVAANAFPGELAGMVNAVRRGDYMTARQAHLNLAEMCRVLFEEGNPAGIKSVLHQKKVIAYETLRLPLMPVSDSLTHKIEGILRKM